MDYTLPNPPILVEDGDFDFETLPGKVFTLMLTGEFGGATVALSVQSQTLTGFTPVANGTWTSEAEIDFIATGLKTRLTVTGASGPTAIRVTRVGHDFYDPYRAHLP